MRTTQRRASLAPGGQFWAPIRGHDSMPIDTQEKIHAIAREPPRKTGERGRWIVQAPHRLSLRRRDASPVNRLDRHRRAPQVAVGHPVTPHMMQFHAFVPTARVAALARGPDGWSRSLSPARCTARGGAAAPPGRPRRTTAAAFPASQPGSGRACPHRGTPAGGQPSEPSRSASLPLVNYGKASLPPLLQAATWSSAACRSAGSVPPASCTNAVPGPERQSARRRPSRRFEGPRLRGSRRTSSTRASGRRSAERCRAAAAGKVLFQAPWGPCRDRSATRSALCMGGISLP
jgi:hypothetical protein